MPVKQPIFESMPNQWFTKDSDIEVKSKSNAITANPEAIATDDNSYKTALNDSVVDDLVSTLTNKLCLKPSHRLCRMSRLSPYQIHNSTSYRSQPSRSCYCLNCKYFTLNSNNSNMKSKTALKRSSSMSDTYELMQQLLNEGSLIKEAVKRLQFEGQSDDKKRIDFYCSDDELNETENQFNLLNS